MLFFTNCNCLIKLILSFAQVDPKFILRFSKVTLSLAFL